MIKSPPIPESGNERLYFKSNALPETLLDGSGRIRIKCLCRHRSGFGKVAAHEIAAP